MIVRRGTLVNSTPRDSAIDALIRRANELADFDLRHNQPLGKCIHKLVAEIEAVREENNSLRKLLTSSAEKLLRESGNLAFHSILAENDALKARLSGIADVLASGAKEHFMLHNVAVCVICRLRHDISAALRGEPPKP